MFVIRWWRDIGEQPCVWSNFGLRFIGCDVDHLLEVLSLGRLQGLQQLHWIPCVEYHPDLPILDIIAENHAGIIQISLEMFEVGLVIDIVCDRGKLKIIFF